MTVIKLTPEGFRELDILVRTEAGCALSVFDWMEGKSSFGCFSWQPEGLYLNLRITEAPGCCCERLFIKVANQIDTDRFAKEPRPEMDWGTVPERHIYKFIVFHEMGHRLFDFDAVWHLGISAYDTETIRLLNICNEVRADRYGWEKVFPEDPFPQRPDRDRFLLERITEFMDSHKQWFPREPWEIVPISTNPKEMIPVSHIKKGIPWA